MGAGFGPDYAFSGRSGATGSYRTDGRHDLPGPTPRPPGAPMPTLIPAVTAPAIPPLSTAAAANARPDETAPQSTFGTVLAQAQAGTPSGAASPTALPAPQSANDTSGTDPNTGEIADPTRVAAESAAGLFVVGPGVVLSSTGAPVSGADATGAPAQPPAPPSDADQPTDAVSRAAEFRLREFVAPQALPQTATARLATTPNAPTPPGAAEEVIEANATTDAPPPAGTAAQALPLPAAAAVPVPATGLPAGRSPSVVAQVPVVSDLVVPPAAAPSVAETAAPPVVETVAAAPLPGVTVGDRPNTVGDRLAADAADGARLAATRPTQAAEPFAQVLASTAPAQPAPVAPPADAATARPTAPAVGDIRVSQPAPVAVPVTTPTTPAVTASTPTAPAVVAPRSNVAAPVTAEAVAPPADPTATTTARPAAAGPLAAPLTTTTTPAVAPNATPLPVTFAEVFRGRPAVEVEPTRATTTPADATPDATAAFVASAAPPAPTTTPAAPAAPAAVAQPAAVQVADGITAHVRTLDRSGETEFRMRLDPPELGRVHVRLLADGDAVRGQVLVADEAVRQVIESQLPELRQRLEAAGLSVGRFDVSTDPGANGRGNPYQPASDLGAEPAATARPATRAATPARSGRVDVTV